ncbi:hypothetical protein TREES_T100015575 [Tupaia chinensis]|uniref:Uncharacterized protein n=1 Tax=Tupaia chinensis TaxID=246437 RepID=L9LAJ1_TUPCH|nr:hypothetical protein TREES_T100015575 [Tupaia chinensis]
MNTPKLVSDTGHSDKTLRMIPQPYRNPITEEGQQKRTQTQYCEAKALSSVTFLPIYLAGSLFLVTCAQETLFLPVRFVLQGTKATKPELPPSEFILYLNTFQCVLKYRSFQAGEEWM